jgi:kynureninase
MSWKKHFSRFLNAAPDRLHFAAHSHHPWPDVTFEAHQQAWQDAARLADAKWDRVFGEIIPEAQAHVARVLNLPDPRTVVFAPSTHDLLMRLVSAIDARPLRVLTTDGEFHSFARQMKRLEESGAAHVRRVAVEPFESFPARMREAIALGACDLVYFSQCFYNTGYRLAGLDAMVQAAPDAKVPIVIDGYHGYMAVPTDLAKIAARAFYIGGGYKYAMCGEGACFMHCPPDYAQRPSNTGWFASFGTLTTAQDGAVPYAEGGQRFMGATFDPTPLYRLNAVQRWLQEIDVGVMQIRTHVEALQQQLLAAIAKKRLLPGAALMPPPNQPRGNFLIFRHERAPDWHRRLLEQNVMTDLRADRLRIGFGMYQDPEDVDELSRRLGAL